MPSDRQIALGLAAASAGLLLGAFGFEYFADLPPCPLCIGQRWAHAAAIAAGLIAAAILPRRRGTIFLALAAVFVVSAGLALHHVGVEQGWWQGFSACTAAGTLGAGSVADLRARLMAAPVVRCDEVPWALFGISLAGWNLLASLGLAGIALAALRWGR
ncbi:MAG: disulfide bond formation protein B [Alphaproteobacteria bacterium]|nr:disulfide bond formation protein B [Alphaproteobacteria bacterium]